MAMVMMRSMLTVLFVLCMSSFAGAQILNDCSNVVALYHLDGNANDASGNGNHGSVNGAVPSGDGMFNQSYDFDGLNDFIEINNTNLLAKGSMSVSVWTKLRHLYPFEEGPHLVSKWDDVEGYSFLMEINPYNPFINTVANNGMVYDLTFYNKPSMPLNQWMHVAFTYDGGSNLYMYINGVKSNPGVYIGWNFNQHGAKVNIGRRPDGKHYVWGLIDEVVMYNRALTASEVSQLYNASTPVSCGPPPNCTDNDADGYNIEGGSCGSVDCDDNDASINPGAAEVCDDALDNNCDGLIDNCDSIPEIISPATGSTLSGSTETFNWTGNGTAVSGWYLWAGSCNTTTYNSCGDDYYNSGQLGGGSLSATATGLPTDGSTVYVRLWYNSGGWQSVLFQYTANTAGGGGTPEITSPATGSTLSGSTETFNWTGNGTAVSGWYLWAGSCNTTTYNSCGDDYYNSGQLGGGSLSATATGLPTDGSTVYVRLWYNSGGWQSVLFQYTANTAGGGGTPEITSPATGSTLSGSTETFNWTGNGTAVSGWYLWAGSCNTTTYNSCGDDYYNSGQLGGGSLSATATGLPTDGSTVYVRLWYREGGVWKSVLSQYTGGI